jgi:hypothetical protein
MNRRVCVCVGLIVWSRLIADVAFAQAPAAAPAAEQTSIPVEYKNTPDATPFRAKIRQFIDGQLDKMSSEDSAVLKAARDKLISESAAAGSSSSFFDVYTQELNLAVVALLGKDPTPRLRIRLNLAVMIEAVAQNAKTDQVEDAVIKLINDPSDVVALWGMKAARPVVAAMLAGPTPDPKDKLVLAILPAVKLHAKAGYVAAEAYPALIPGNVNATTLAIILDPLIDVLKFRTTLYVTGIPDDPEAETSVASFLASRPIRVTMNPQQEQQIMQALVDLISVAGQQAQTAAKADLEQINTTLLFVAQGLSIIANPGTQVVNLNQAMGITPRTPGPQVYQRTQIVYPSLKTAFPNLTPPPTATPATSPTTTTAN